MVDRSGRVRLIVPTPDWENIVDLALTETRHYGATSIHVARRLRAMLEHLVERVPQARKAALRRELDLLETSVARSFADAEDRRRANIGDVQGLGGSSSRGGAWAGDVAASAAEHPA